MYVNETADAAADAAADHQGTHDEELKTEEFYKARLQKILCRLSAIEKYIRDNAE